MIVIVSSLSFWIESLLLSPVGFGAVAGMIVIICSASVSVVFLGELVSFLIILSIFASLLDGLWSLFIWLSIMNAPGLSEVIICIGLPWEESEAKFFISTDLFFCSFVVSNWTRSELTFWCWRCFALSSLDWAKAASFERTSKSLLGLWARLDGVVALLFICFNRSSWSGLVRLSVDPLGRAWARLVHMDCWGRVGLLLLRLVLCLLVLLFC